MKKIKVNYNGKKYKYIYNATPFQVFKYKLGLWFRRAVYLGIVALIGYVIFLFGGYMNPATIVTTSQVIKEIPTKAQILEDIADCESGKRLPNGKAVKGSARHYAPSGQVLMTGNTNKSVDVGKYAINSVWFKKATELGLDITKEEDNKAMAQWIFENRGSEDWYPSKACWSK